MAKPKKDADRRAVVDQLRREQQRKERRRSLMVVGAAVAVGAVVIGAAVWVAMQEDEKSGRELTAIGAGASKAGCQEIVTEPAEGNNDHRGEGEKILYARTPPAMGAHWGQFLIGNQIRAFWSTDDRPPVERLVHSLEHGHTILWYDETISEDAAALDEVETVAEKAAEATGGKFMAAPWTEEDGEAFPEGTHVALTHWSVNKTFDDASDDVGVWQYCTEVSGDAVDEFITEYPETDAPEPGAA